MIDSVIWADNSHPQGDQGNVLKCTLWPTKLTQKYGIIETPDRLIPEVWHCHLFLWFPIFYNENIPNPSLCIGNSSPNTSSTSPLHSHSALAWHFPNLCSMEHEYLWKGKFMLHGKSHVWEPLCSWKVKICFFLLKIWRSISFFNEFSNWHSCRVFLIFFHETL